MERASHVMYSIANIFNWIALILSVVGAVFAILTLVHVGDFVTQPIPFLVYCIIVFIFCLVIISMVRIAKDRKSSKGWDVLFIVLGVLAMNPFYILGGIFGVIARR